MYSTYMKEINYHLLNHLYLPVNLNNQSKYITQYAHFKRYHVHSKKSLFVNDGRIIIFMKIFT